MAGFPWLAIKQGDLGNKSSMESDTNIDIKWNARSIKVDVWPPSFKLCSIWWKCKSSIAHCPSLNCWSRNELVSVSWQPKNRKKSSVVWMRNAEGGGVQLPTSCRRHLHKSSDRSTRTCVWLWELGIGGCITASQQSVDDITSLRNTASNVISVGEQHSSPALNHVCVSMASILEC